MRLQAMHVVAAVLHLGLGIWATVQASTTVRKWDPATYVLQTKWLQQSNRHERCTNVDEGCVVKSYVGSKIPINAYALIAVFFFVSAVAETWYAAACKNYMAGGYRWLEYAISAAIQFFVICVLSNCAEFFAAILGAVLIGFLQITGYVLEESLLRTQPFERLHAKARKTPTRFQIHIMVAAFLVLCIAWVPVWYHIGRATGTPNFVYGLVAFSFGCYLAFGIVMVFKLGAGCCAATPQSCEFAYTLLSFIAKAGVMMIYYFGVQMRDNRIITES